MRPSKNTVSSTVLVAARGDDDAPGGLYSFRQHDDQSWTGRHLARAANLAALCHHPHEPLVYGVAGPQTGSLHVWKLNLDEPADLLTTTPTGGDEPCHVEISPDGQLLIICNYRSSQITVMELNSDGLPAASTTHSLTGTGPDRGRQAQAHPHQALFTDDGSHLTVVDLGADQLRHFRRDGHQITQQSTSVLPAGSGPRHLAHRHGRPVCVSGELASTALVPSMNADQPWISIPSSSRSGPALSRSLRNYPGDVQPHPTATVAYLANRGHDTISVIELNDCPGVAQEVNAAVSWPQHLLVTSTQLLVAGSDSSDVVSFDLDPTTGRIAAPPQHAFRCPGPAWLLAQPHR